MLSWINLPPTKALWLGEIRKSRSSLSLVTLMRGITFKIYLQQLIGLNWTTFSGDSTLGIKATIVSFISAERVPKLKNSLIAAQTKSLIVAQRFLKKSPFSPSGSGASKPPNKLTASAISISETDITSLLFKLVGTFEESWVSIPLSGWPPPTGKSPHNERQRRS